jgi:hypothetical protein
METAQEKIERWKGLAELFLKNNTQAYIKEINGDFHFCDILLVGEESIYIYNFGPEQRKGLKDKVYWYLISEFDEYKGEVKNAKM